MAIDFKFKKCIYIFDLAILLFEIYSVELKESISM